MASLLGILFVLLIVALVIAVILTIMEKITKIAIPLLVIALLVVGAFYFISDTAELQQKFETENKLFLLEIDSSVAGAFSVRGNQDPVIIDDLSRFSGLEQENLDPLLDSYYKIIIVHWSALDDVSSISAGDLSVSAQEARSVFRSGNPLGLLPPQAASLFPTEDSVKSSLFNLMFGAAYQDTDLIGMYRAGDVDIYPETMGLKVIKLTPDFILKKLVRKNV